MALLDYIDKNILNIMQQNGRISATELAEKVSVSKTACWKRMQRLQNEGYIKYTRAKLDPDKLGFSVLVTIGVILDRSTPDSFSEFEKAIKRVSAVQECLLLAGEFDYWLKVRVADVPEFNKLHIALPTKK